MVFAELISNVIGYVSKLYPKSKQFWIPSLPPPASSSQESSDLEFDVLRAYVSSTKDLLNQWKEAKENHARLTKIYKENKMSVDILRKNNTTYLNRDELADGSDLFLEPIEVKLELQNKQLQSVHVEFEELQTSIMNKKKECKFILDAISHIYQEMILVSIENCEGDSNDPFLAQVANVVYAKFDNEHLSQSQKTYARRSSNETQTSSPSLSNHVLPSNDDMEPQ